VAGDGAFGGAAAGLIEGFVPVAFAALALIEDEAGVFARRFPSVDGPDLGDFSEDPAGPEAFPRARAGGAF
jgi:hypothetical protein